MLYFSTFFKATLNHLYIDTPEEGQPIDSIVRGNLKNLFQKTMDGKNDCYHK
ncbi:hypothetical protein [Neochlamydia sp. S13]|uniref:hypothetical protein n=1 Tax=Neochlamydia sp. S13 TaxID=1353976 RepID=UPI001E2EEB12|nr:hypothetical protein [Neochlamydia sp. S13]